MHTEEDSSFWCFSLRTVCVNLLYFSVNKASLGGSVRQIMLLDHLASWIIVEKKYVPLTLAQCIANVRTDGIMPHVFGPADLLTGLGAKNNGRKEVPCFRPWCGQKCRSTTPTHL